MARPVPSGLTALALRVTPNPSIWGQTPFPYLQRGAERAEKLGALIAFDEPEKFYTLIFRREL